MYAMTVYSKNQSKFFPSPNHSSTDGILYLAFFDVPFQIHWPAHVAALRISMCHVAWLAFRAKTGNAAGPNICWYYVALGTGCEGMLLYCTNPLTGLWNKKFKQGPHWALNTRSGSDYRKMESSFSDRRTLDRKPQSVPSFELKLHGTVYLPSKKTV